MEKIQLVKKRKSKKNAYIIHNKNTETKIKVCCLAELHNAFQKQHGDTALIDKNQHTARLSDTLIAYDIDLQRKYLLSENPQLFLIFKCIDLVNYIKKMNLACAYLEDIPSTGYS